jgi:hypothetical protein
VINGQGYVHGVASYQKSITILLWSTGGHASTPALLDSAGDGGVYDQVSNHLGTAGYREFGKDPAQVCGHGPHANLQGASDRLIGAAGGYHAGDLLLARAEWNESAGLVPDTEAPDVSDNGVKEYSLVAVGAIGTEAHHGHNLAKYFLEPLTLRAAVAFTRWRDDVTTCWLIRVLVAKGDDGHSTDYLVTIRHQWPLKNRRPWRSRSMS